MPSAPADEVARLTAVREISILDTAPEQIYDDVVRLAASICDTPIAVINFVDADRQWGKALVGLESSEAPRDASFCARTIAREDGLLIVPDTQMDPLWSSNPQVVGDPGLRFYAGAALVTDAGHALGSLCVADNREPRALDAPQIEALQALARQTVAHLELRKRSLELADANEALRRLATRDQLTGLPNRMLLEETLTLALRRRLRSGEPLGILFCDVDHFKQVNDTLGHHDGDIVLQAVAQRLSQAARASDLVARIAGDEFVVLCSELTAGEDLKLVARRLRDVVSAPLAVGDQTLTMNLSVGAALASDDDTIEDLLRRADHAMYEVKRSRR